MYFVDGCLWHMERNGRGVGYSIRFSQMVGDTDSLSPYIKTHFLVIGPFHPAMERTRYLTPKEQAYIRQVFCNKGITEEPPFTRYTDEYMW